MIARILEILTGKDDVERIAEKGDLQLLNDYLRTRRLWFPTVPTRFLDAATHTQQELIELAEHEAKQLSGDAVELWIVDMDGKKRLPAFSSRKKMETYSAKVSRQLNKVFALKCVEALLPDIAETTDVDVIDLNCLSERSWEIGVRRQP